MQRSDEQEQTDGRTMAEEPIDIPMERINPETLRMMIEEFVTREWSDMDHGEQTLEQKVRQVMQQLKSNRAKITFDVASESWNIISSQEKHL